MFPGGGMIAVGSASTTSLCPRSCSREIGAPLAGPNDKLATAGARGLEDTS